MLWIEPETLLQDTKSIILEFEYGNKTCFWPSDTREKTVDIMNDEPFLSYNVSTQILMEEIEQIALDKIYISMKTLLNALLIILSQSDYCCKEWNFEIDL